MRNDNGTRRHTDRQEPAGLTSGLHCPTCKAKGRLGYCAPLRCYCLHEDCPAFSQDPTLAHNRQAE